MRLGNGRLVILDLSARPLNVPHVAPDVLYQTYPYVLWWAADLVATLQQKLRPAPFLVYALRTDWFLALSSTCNDFSNMSYSGIPLPSGQGGNITPTVSGIPSALERGGKIRSGPFVGKVATSPLPSRGCPQLHSEGENQKWPTRGQSGYITPVVSGIPTTSQPGGK